MALIKPVGATPSFTPAPTSSTAMTPKGLASYILAAEVVEKQRQERVEDLRKKAEEHGQRAEKAKAEAAEHGAKAAGHKAKAAEHGAREEKARDEVAKSQAKMDQLRAIMAARAASKAAGASAVPVGAGIKV